MERERITERIREAQLGGAEDAIIATIQPTIRLETRAVAEDELRLGASKLGGSPDLPPGFAWPESDGTPHSFIAQLGLGEASACDAECLLPTSGRLYFFYDCIAWTWGFDPADRGHWLVAWSDADASTLTRTQIPWKPPAPHEPTEKEGFLARLLGPKETAAPEEPPVFTACQVTFHASACLPGPDAPAVERLALTEDQQSRLLDVEERLLDDAQTRGALHRLLGYPVPVQNDMLSECAVVTLGLSTGGPSEELTAKWEKVRQRPPEWRLLLQVDTDANAGMMWGDCGMLYYCIRDADLRARRFDDTWLILQCY